MVGAKCDVSQNLTTSAGISIVNNTVQCYDCTLRCREGPLLKDPIHFFLYSPAEVRRRDEEAKENSRARA